MIRSCAAPPIPTPPLGQASVPDRSRLRRLARARFDDGEAVGVVDAHVHARDHAHDRPVGVERELIRQPSESGATRRGKECVVPAILRAVLTALRRAGGVGGAQQAGTARHRDRLGYVDRHRLDREPRRPSVQDQMGGETAPTTAPALTP